MDTANQNLYQQLADRLTRSITSGTLARGERLPSMRDQARREGVSLSTVALAYRWLEDARLVEARPRSGYFVALRAPRLPEPQPSKPPVTSQIVDVSLLAEEVMRRANDPSFISFGAACPSGDLFAHERVRRAIGRAAQRHRESLVRYPTGPGSETLRRAIARHAIGMGCQLEANDILITNGCLDSISLCLRVVARPGDVVALESPTYFGFLQVLESLGLRALEIPTHPRTGLSLDALRLAIDTQPVKAVLTVPTLSNPLGASMPVAERRRLAQMVAAHGIALIEDVLYNDLAEQDDKRRAIKSFDSDGSVMLCGSFSKTVAPGLRVGWVDGGRWGAELRRLKAVLSGGSTEVLELAMADLLTQPGHEAHYRQLRRTVAARVDEARGLVAASFPQGTRVTDPAGGYILWVELPAGIDSLALFHTCLAERICIAPGTMFSSTNRFQHCIRLGVGGRWDDAQRDAIRRIGAITHGMVVEQRRSIERRSVA